MTTKGKSLWMVGLAAAVAGLALLAACEKGEPNVGDVDDYMSEEGFSSADRSGVIPGDLTIDPLSAAVTEAGQEILFTASGGEPPYNWSVANGNGQVVVIGDAEAMYRAASVSPNSVIVKDRDGQAAMASVTATSAAPAELTAKIDPGTLSADGDKAIGTVEGGTPPYHWTVIDAGLGHIVGSDQGVSVVYERDNAGDNVLRVVDGGGLIVNLLVKQP